MKRGLKRALAEVWIAGQDWSDDAFLNRWARFSRPCRDFNGFRGLAACPALKRWARFSRRCRDFNGFRGLAAFPALKRWARFSRPCRDSPDDDAGCMPSAEALG